MLHEKINNDTYQGYLVRFWRRDAEKVWRVTIQFVGCQEQYHFGTVEEALTFLQVQVNKPA